MNFLNGLYDKICRTCLTLLEMSEKQHGNSILNSDLKDKILNLTSVQVSKENKVYLFNRLIKLFEKFTFSRKY